jgi:ferredoxin-thioredoxin reductase catalytic subunit
MIGEKEIQQKFERLNVNQKNGYFLNPDESFTRPLIQSLLINAERYGYDACPCRLATGKKEDDLDIICPCYYRDPDLSDYGSCYCGLYVSKKIFESKEPIKPIPERRPEKAKREKLPHELENSSYPVWRCDVCGYLCAREQPPEICPICGAGKERFSRF